MSTEEALYRWAGLGSFTGKPVLPRIEQELFVRIWNERMALNRQHCTCGIGYRAGSLVRALGMTDVAAICDLAGNTTFVTSTVWMAAVTNAEYGYSPAGCLTSAVYRGAQYTNSLALTWNGQYQLAAVETNGVVAETHAYDALGRRVRTISAGLTNWMVYDGPHVVADVDEDGRLLRSYVHGPGIDNLLAMTVHTGATAVTYYALTDHLGTVHALADESGAVVESYRYDAWGRVLGVYGARGAPLEASAVGNRFLWQGREYSWATGLYYFRARWNDPVTGRWLSNDPIGISGGLNQYVFCGNNPVNFTDPYGLFWEEFAFWNPESAVGRQFVSIGDAMGGSAAWVAGYRSGARNVLQEAVSGSGQAILDEECAGKGARIAYWGAIGISAAADITAGALIGLEAAGVSQIGSANMGWRGGEITFTRPGAPTPDWRFNPFGGSGYGPHYHRRGPGGIGRHRPWQPGPGGFPGRF